MKRFKLLASFCAVWFWFWIILMSASIDPDGLFLRICLPYLACISAVALSFIPLLNYAACNMSWNTTYLVTDRRVLAARGTKTLKISSILLRDIDRVEVIDRRGIGEIQLFLDGKLAMTLLGVDDAAHVVRQIDGGRTAS